MTKAETKVVQEAIFALKERVLIRMAAGIITAQSIGEPGTQMTMRKLSTMLVLLR